MSDDLRFLEQNTCSLEVYGFVLWLSTIITGAVYLGWGYLDDKTLINLGITYYPEKYVTSSIQSPHPTITTLTPIPTSSGDGL
jgi:hypothetical protein